MAKQGKAVSKNIAKDGINYKKLFFELMAVLTVIFVAVIIILYSFFVEKGVISDDKYAQYRYIVEEVDNYDYSNGRNLELEKRLDEGYEKTNSDTKAYFYAFASMIYYCNIGYYNTAIEAYNWLNFYSLGDEKENLELEKRRVLCERKMASKENQ